MVSIDDALLELKRLDRLASGDTPLHRLDPRAKVLATLFFLCAVVSFGRYELTALFPFFVFPVVLIAIGNLPAGYIVRKVGLVMPLALVMGIFNPLFDRQPMVQVGALAISGGWLSCITIVVRTMLTVGSVLILVAVTGVTAICRAVEQLGMPRVFTVQLLFLHRYLFVLAEEGGRASRARELRSFGRQGMGIGSYGSLIGHLLLRTWQRAERVHMAMLARGFTGEFPALRASVFGLRELVFLAGWTALFVAFRLHNIPRMLGEFVTGVLP